MNGKPEVNEGYTRIANELTEAILRYPFSKREIKIVLYILRYSYGYQQKYVIDGMNKKKMIAEKTGIRSDHIIPTLQSLVQKNIIKIENNHLQLNKYYKEWKLLNSPKRVINSPKRVINSPKRGIASPTNTDEKTPPETPKEIYKEIYKENIKKENIGKEKSQNQKPQKRITYDVKTERLIGITEKDKKEYREAFPGVNIEAEIRRMELWLRANPTRRKKNYEKFIFNWLRNAAQNKTKGEKWYGVTTKLTKEEEKRLEQQYSFKAGEW